MHGIAGMFLSWVAIASGAIAVPDSVLDSKAPQSEIDRARHYIVSLLGDEIGATCTVETASAIIITSAEQGYIGLDSWSLLARFRPKVSWDLECSFVVASTKSQEYSMVAHRNDFVIHRGEVPDCRHHPELCDITIDRAAAEQIGNSRGIQPSDEEYSAELELSGSVPGIVWRVSSRPKGEACGRVLVIDAGTGEIREDHENEPCWE